MRVLFMLSAVALVTLSTQVVQGKCFPPEDYGFLTTSGVVPANFPGVLYWDPGPYTRDSDGKTRVVKQLLSIERLDRRQRLKLVQTPLQKMILLAPEGGFERGARYLFKDLRQHNGAGPREVEIIVDSQTLDADAPLHLEVSEQKRDTEVVDEPSGCDSLKPVDHIYRDFQLSLPPGQEAYARLLHVEFNVNGTPWRSSSEICTVDFPGHNWLGPSHKNRIFTVCGQASNPTPSVAGLPFGEHIVTAVGRLPGSDVEFMLTSTPIILEDNGCSTSNRSITSKVKPSTRPKPRREPPTPQFDVGAESGCNVVQRSPYSPLVACGGILALLAFWRRR